MTTEQRIADLEKRVKKLERKLANMASYLVRADDSHVKRAGREL